MRRFAHVASTVGVRVRLAPHAAVACAPTMVAVTTQMRFSGLGNEECRPWHSGPSAAVRVKGPPPASQLVAKWSVEDVGTWLTECNVSSEARTAFGKNRIDGFVLVGGLSDQDLKSIGVDMFGDRRIIAKALCELRCSSWGGEPTKPDNPPEDVAARDLVHDNDVIATPDRQALEADSALRVQARAATVSALTATVRVACAMLQGFTSFCALAQGRCVLLPSAVQTILAKPGGATTAGVIKRVRTADAQAFEADYSAVVSSMAKGSNAHSCEQVTVRVVDVCLSSHEFSHPVFRHIRSMKRLLSLPLGDKCTAALSMSCREAGIVQAFLCDHHASVREAAVRKVEAHFSNPATVVEEFPALHFIGLQDYVVHAAFTPEHKQRLVNYGEGVLRCLMTEVQPALSALDPCFKHNLTCDLRFMTGLQRAYTPELLQQVRNLEWRLEQIKEVTKEDDPYYAVISLPRMGKSLLLQDLARSLDAKRKHVACITYTSGTLVAPGDRESVDGAVTGFFARLVIACVFPTHYAPVSDTDLATYFQQRGLTVHDFFATMQYLGVRIPEVVFVDEFTKLLDEFSENDQKHIMRGIAPLFARAKLVFSGFTTSVTHSLKTANGRDVVTHFFGTPSVAAQCIEDFRVRLSPHRSSMMKISPLLYLSSQCAPGVLGHLFETMTEGEASPPPLHELLRDAVISGEGDQLVSWLRDLTTKELCGTEADPALFVEAQRQGVALVVNMNTTVAPPFAFVAVLEAAEMVHVEVIKRGVVTWDTNVRWQNTLLVDLVRQLSVMSRMMHRQGEEILRATGDAKHVLEMDLRTTKGDYLELATFHARALRMLAKHHSAESVVEIDPACDLKPSEGVSQAGLVNMESRITAVKERLSSLRDRKIGAFVWKFSARDDAFVDIAEGEYTNGRWAITLSEVRYDGEFERLVQKSNTLLKSIAHAPSLFDAVDSVDLVLLAPGAIERPEHADAIDRNTIAIEKMGCPLKTRTLTDFASVQRHLSTPIAALLPGGQFRGHEGSGLPSSPSEP